MKNTILIILTVIFPLTLNAEECSCGSFETGTYDYAVVDDSGGCCEGKNNTDFPSYFTTYTPGPGTTWIVRDIQRITFSEAIRACCPPA